MEYNLKQRVMEENIIKAKLEELLPGCEVQVWHPTQFISVEMVSAKDIVLPSDAIDFLVSLHIKEMHYGYEDVGHIHPVTFKVEG